jgi:tetratricopeptide (TPR) repeat protein
MVDLKLAETLLAANRSDQFEEAYNLCKDYPINELRFNSDKFYYAELLAQLCDKMGKKEEAKEYAKAAIEISKITEPQFNRHKTVGIINATNNQLQTLERIVRK